MTWLVLGAGTSGRGAALLLRSLKKKVVVSEQKTLTTEQRDFFLQHGIACIEEDACSEKGTPQHKPSPFCEALEGLVLSPGVPLTHPYVVMAQKKSIPLWSEIDLALAHYSGTVLGITGTNGKSTSVSMLAHLLSKLGLDVCLAGNIGVTPSEILATGRKPAYLVLELSSYQLEQATRLKLNSAAILNITPDHLSRHGTYAAYVKAKWRIFDRMAATDHGFVSSEVAQLALDLGLAKPNCTLHRIDYAGLCASLTASNSGQTEKHNQENALVAVSMAAALLRRDPSDLIPHLRNFTGLAHRCEKLGTVGGQSVINDSKATNVDATLTALRSQNKAVLLFLGGQGKGESFEPLKQYKSVLQQIVTFGADHQKISQELAGLCPILSFATLREALAQLPSYYPSNPPCPLLFSPACASFDEFRDFSERGDFFRTTVSGFLDKKD